MRELKIFVIAILTIARCFGDVEIFEKEELRKAEKELSIFFKEKLRKIPKKHLSALEEVESSAGIGELDVQTLLWLNGNIFPADDELPAFNSLFAEDNDLPAEERSLILMELFWKTTKGLEYKTGSLIKEHQKGHADQKRPEIEFYPGTKDEIDWRWKLPDPDLGESILHVGIMKESRQFVCFKHERGIYLPTGSTLERIRADIVQDPLMASGIGESFFRKDKNR